MHAEPSPFRPVLRIVSIVALLLGLGDIALFLGITEGLGANPVTTLGFPVFFAFSGLAVARLFAAVGLWLDASWGGGLLAFTSLTELAVLGGGGGLPISWLGIAVRLGLIVALAVVLALHLRLQRHAAD